MKVEGVARIHEASLRILDEVGVRLEHGDIVARLVAAGARHGSGPHDVRLPPAMVREHLALAPRRVELAARDGTTTVLGPESESVFWTTPVLYLWTGVERRPVTSADLRPRPGLHGVGLRGRAGRAGDDVRARDTRTGGREPRVGTGPARAEVTLSLAQLVIDDEMVAYVRRFRRGFPVDDAALALDVVRAVGIAGSYLDVEHTLEHHRRELFSPRLLNRRARGACPGPLPEVAEARARGLLAGEDAPALAEDEREALLAVERSFASG